MLVLARRPGETLIIGEDVTVTVIAIKGGSVRVGVSAPKHVPVHRKEIWERIQVEKEAANDAVPAGGETNGNK